MAAYLRALTLLPPWFVAGCLSSTLAIKNSGIQCREPWPRLVNTSGGAYPSGTPRAAIAHKRGAAAVDPKRSLREESCRPCAWPPPLLIFDEPGNPACRTIRLCACGRSRDMVCKSTRVT